MKVAIQIYFSIYIYLKLKLPVNIHTYKCNLSIKLFDQLGTDNDYTKSKGKQQA